MPQVDKKSHQEWQKRYRADKVARGICAICLRPCYQGKKACREHLERKRRRNIIVNERYRRRKGIPILETHKGIRHIQSFITKEDHQCLVQAKKHLKELKALLSNGKPHSVSPLVSEA